MIIKFFALVALIEEQSSFDTGITNWYFSTFV